MKRINKSSNFSSYFCPDTIFVFLIPVSVQFPECRTYMKAIEMKLHINISSPLSFGTREFCQPDGMINKSNLHSCFGVVVVLQKT